MNYRTGTDSPVCVAVSSAKRAFVQRALLSWYDAHRRDLPWRRRAHDPYAQWVAEIMLQQTRVETVVGYYDAFLKRFPTLSALARARRQSVLKSWEGLGYYRRVLNLHDAAKLLVRAGEAIPSTAAALGELPGVGTYTAAAIASIAYQEPVAAVDGNVARVIARLFHIEADVLSSAGRRQIGALAARLLPPDRPGDFNQAWMDFANLVCTPRTPSCKVCPFASRCGARRRGHVGRLPVRGAGRSVGVPVVNLVVGLFDRNRRTLVRRRPVGGLWSGLWEPPSIEVGGRVTVRSLNLLTRTYELEIEGRPLRLEPIEHRLTHRLVRLQAFAVSVRCGAPRKAAGIRWVTPGQWDALPVPVAYRKVFRLRAETH